MNSAFALLIRAAVIVAAATVLSAQPLNERVLIVYNSALPASLEVAQHYRTARSIPAANLCAINPTSTTSIATQALYESSVRDPIRACLDAVGRRKVLYIVMTYGTPFRLTPDTRGFSVDSALADIWDETASTFAQNADSPEARHQYYSEAQSLGRIYPRFVPLATHRADPATKTIYSVWRLDAPDTTLAKGLVDKAKAAEAASLTGAACFDRNRGNIDAAPDASYYGGDFDIARAAGFAAEAGFPVTEDASWEEFGAAPAPARCDGAALYAGWYSLNNYPNVFTWNTGAIGFHLDSLSAADLRGGGNFTARAVQAGITVTGGAVNEPYLDGLVHVDGFFRNLFEGANVGDAMLRNLPWLKWMNLNVGDPLYTPFRGGRAPFNQSRREDGLALSIRGLVGGEPVDGMVLLSTPAPAGGAVVSLSSSAPSVASVPANVTVPAGATFVAFRINTARPATDTYPRIQATWNGVVRKNSLTVVPLLAPLQAEATTVTGGATIKARVNLHAKAPAGGTLVALSSMNSAVTVPSSVVVPAGESFVEFSMSTAPVATTLDVIVTAKEGEATRTVTIKVLSPVPSSLTVNPTSVISPATATGTVTLTGAAPVGGLTVNLASSSTAASLPASLMVAAGSRTGSFQITANAAATVTATLTASLGTTAKTATLQIRQGAGTPAPPLLGYWNFDETSGTTARDGSGRGFHAAIVEAPSVAGKLNAARSFNGTTYHTVTPSIPFGQAFSVAAWVNPALLRQYGYARIAETFYQTGFLLGVDETGYKYKFIVNNGISSTGGCGRAFGCAEGGTIAAGWHFIAGTYDGAVARLYVDGALVASDTAKPPANESMPLYVGRSSRGNSYGWRGAIDEVRLYEHALSASEVSALHQSIR